MKRIHTAAAIFGLLMLSIFFQSFKNKFGGDYYKVLLNKKLVTEQYLTQPVAMKTLSLTSSNNADNLTVYYSHCGTAGKSRSVSIRNSSGTVLKEWKFADSKTIELQLSVKDVLTASAKNKSLLLYYSSKEIPNGKQLLTIDVSNKTVAKL